MFSYCFNALQVSIAGKFVTSAQFEAPTSPANTPELPSTPLRYGVLFALTVGLGNIHPSAAALAPL
jgi:hypothetical protein